jgi:hypothetical protein
VLQDVRGFLDTAQLGGVDNGHISMTSPVHEDHLGITTLRPRRPPRQGPHPAVLGGQLPDPMRAVAEDHHQDADFFIRNMVAILRQERFAFGVLRTGAIVSMSLAGSGGNGD